MKLISIPFRVVTGFLNRPDRAVGLRSGTPAVDRDHPECVTDGGTDRPSRDTRGEPDLDFLRQSAAPYLFAVDAADQLTTLSKPLSELAAASPGQHLSALLPVPAADTSAHLQTVRQRLRADNADTVRSTACRLRTAAEQRGVTVEFSTCPDADESTADRLVGTIRLAAVELGADQPQPATGPDRFRELFEQLPDPVAEVRFDADEPIVTSVNPAFEETFGYELAALVDEPLNDHIVPEHVDDATMLDREAASGEWTSAEVIRDAADGPRLFLFRGIPFTHDGQQRGFGVYTDVTDKESQQRYHEVLNRLLRHNLRNDLNVIFGLADQLTAALETAETESTAVGERLKQRALDLVETTRRARELESVIDRSATETEPIAVDELIADACVSLRAEYPTVEIDCTIEESAVGIAGTALREAVIELVENAIEHTSVDPTVDVRVECRPDTGSVVITVADDGPGIPPDERDIVDGSRSITPLEHASGLGLWLAKWIAEAYGAEIAFVGPDPELGGAAVELRVRLVEASTPDRTPSADSE